MERNTIQKKIIIWKEQDRSIRLDRGVVTDFPHSRFGVFFNQRLTNLGQWKKGTSVK